MASVRGRLYESGYFFAPVRREVETEFLPWLRQEALSALSNVATARSVTSSSMVMSWYQQAYWQNPASQDEQHDSWVFLPGGRSPASQRLQGHRRVCSVAAAPCLVLPALCRCSL